MTSKAFQKLQTGVNNVLKSLKHDRKATATKIGHLTKKLSDEKDRLKEIDNAMQSCHGFLNGGVTTTRTYAKPQGPKRTARNSKKKVAKKSGRATKGASGSTISDTIFNLLPRAKGKAITAGQVKKAASSKHKTSNVHPALSRLHKDGKVKRYRSADSLFRYYRSVR